MRSFSFYLVRVLPVVAVAIGLARVDCFANPANNPTKAGVQSVSFFNPSLAFLNPNPQQPQSTAPFLEATPNDAPAFSGIKESFYNFAAHQRKEDLGPTLRTEEGSDKPFSVRPQPQAGIVPSGRAPSATTQTPVTQAMARVPGQAVPAPFMQREFTEYSNPLLNNFGGPKYPLPFRHTPPHNPLPVSMNPLSFSDTPYLTGAPASDLVQHALRLNASQRTAEKMLDPSFQSTQAAYQGTMQQAADATSSDAAGSFDSNLSSTSNPLINVANEMAATPTNGKDSKRTISQAIWIVQEMYKRFFMPLALLLLLVGAVITQTANYVGGTFLKNERGPFEGLLRASIAIFLIPATQLAVSYFIDFGNAMTDPVKRAIDAKTITEWSRAITNPKQGMTRAQIERRDRAESTMSATTRAIYGSAHAILNSALMVLGVFQLVMVCYLFLLGPVAASMFAWPDCVGSLFRPVFANWLNALSNVVLWKFWWCTIILCMATRIHWLQDSGGMNFSSPWEPIVYTAFLVMLGYVPFSALDFKPGDMVDSLLEKASKRSA
jgi:hypothetical protein